MGHPHDRPHASHHRGVSLRQASEAGWMQETQGTVDLPGMNAIDEVEAKSP